MMSMTSDANLHMPEWVDSSASACQPAWWLPFSWEKNGFVWFQRPEKKHSWLQTDRCWGQAAKLWKNIHFFSVIGRSFKISPQIFRPRKSHWLKYQCCHMVNSKIFNLCPVSVPMSSTCELNSGYAIRFTPAMENAGVVRTLAEIDSEWNKLISNTSIQYILTLMSGPHPLPWCQLIRQQSPKLPLYFAFFSGLVTQLFL